MFKTGIYIVLERGKMDEVLKEQGFQQTGCITSECAVEVGRMLGVQQMVAGSIGKVGTVYTVSARIFDVQTGKILKSANYDHIGDIGQLLIKGMKAVVLQLTTGKSYSNQVEINTQEASNKSDIVCISTKFGVMKIELFPNLICWLEFTRCRLILEEFLERVSEVLPPILWQLNFLL